MLPPGRFQAAEYYQIGGTIFQNISAMLFGMTLNAQLKIDPPVTLEQLVGKGQELPSLPEIY